MTPDSLIFDMDGTLWDNVNSYVKVWNIGLELTGFGRRVTRQDLLCLMGKEISQMMEVLVPESSKAKRTKLMHAVFNAYNNLADRIEPLIFPGVLDGLELLATKYKLLLLSNCEEGGLVKFMNHTKTPHLFIDYIEYGQNLQAKHKNIQLLIERNNLQSAVYVGDTDSDSRETRKAGIPFIFASYGFGETDDYDLKFDSFSNLVEYYMRAIQSNY